MAALKELLKTYLTRKVDYEKGKVREKDMDLFFRQKKQMWYHLMNAVDGQETKQAPETENHLTDDNGNE